MGSSLQGGEPHAHILYLLKLRHIIQGRDGLERVLSILKDELEIVMRLSGMHITS